MRPRPDKPLRHRKARDRALILPLIGLLLLLPPVAGIFRMEAALGGIPLIVVCIFFVWAGLIAGAALLAPRLREAETAEHAGPGNGADTGAEHAVAEHAVAEHAKFQRVAAEHSGIGSAGIVQGGPGEPGGREA